MSAVADLVIADLVAHTDVLEASVVVYRELAVAGIHHAHSLRLELAQLRAAHERLIDEYRHLREHDLREAIAS